MRHCYLFLALLVACTRNNGWGDLDARNRVACENTLADLHQKFDTYEPTKPIAAALASFDRGRVLDDCVRIVRPEIEPCLEYAWGSDSAESCLNRRADKAFADAWAGICRYYVKDEKVRWTCTHWSVDSAADNAMSLWTAKTFGWSP